MSRILKLASAALIALTLAFGATYTLTLASGTSTLVAMPIDDCDDDPECDPPPPPPPPSLQGDPSQWGVESAYKKGSFDITEFGDPQELLAAGGTSKGGDTPVVTG
jgi:hypothetical protein